MIQRCLFFLWFTGLACLAAAQPLPALIPYNDGKLWGYCDTNGMVKIAPQWDEANFFEDGRAVVHIARSPAYALIDTKGAYVIPSDKYWNGYLPDWTAPGDIVTEQIEWSGNRPRPPSLNIRDSSGKWGLINANGKLVIPIEWEGQYGYGNAPEFYYNSYLRRFMLLGIKHGKYGLTDAAGQSFIPAVYEALYPLDSFFVAIAGKRTTIIDVYNRRILLKSYDRLTSYAGFALVTLNGKTGAVAYPSGKVIVPIIYDAISPSDQNHGSYDKGTALFNITQNGKKGVIRLPSGDTVLPFIYSSISRINDSLFIVSKNGRDGIVDRHNHYVVWPKYTRISMEGSSLLVVKRGRYQVWGISSMQPFTKWKKYEFFKTDMEYRLMNYPRERLDYRIIPKIRINGKDTNRFIKDGFEWMVTAKLEGGNYAAEGTYSQHQIPGVSSVTLVPGRYLAIINTGLQYIAGPYRYSPERLETIEQYNPYDRLITLKSYGRYGRSGDFREADSFAIVNANFQPVFPLQPFPIHKAFIWNGHVYALLFTYKSKMETGSGSYHGGMSYRTDYIGAKTRLSRDDSGFVPALEPYNIIRLSDRYGGETPVFRDYFFVTDSSGNAGIVDISGRVQLPGVSFRFPYISVIANGLFLLPDKGIVDSTGSSLFPPAVAVQSVSPARRWHNNYRRQDADLPYPIFRVGYSIKSKRGYFYIDSKGRAYIDHEALSP